MFGDTLLIYEVLRMQNSGDHLFSEMYWIIILLVSKHGLCEAPAKKMRGMTGPSQQQWLSPRESTGLCWLVQSCLSCLISRILHEIPPLSVCHEGHLTLSGTCLGCLSGVLQTCNYWNFSKEVDVIIIQKNWFVVMLIECEACCLVV